MTIGVLALVGLSPERIAALTAAGYAVREGKKYESRIDAVREAGERVRAVSRELWIAVALLLPVAWTGVWVGNRVHVRMASGIVARLIGAALLLTGAALIVRTL